MAVYTAVKHLTTKAIVLGRINYGESDRIITVITPEHGKLRLMAKGSRALKSKLAGGIELFCVSDIGFIFGRGGIATLTSSRLEQNFSRILSDISRVQLGYELLKIINSSTEDQAEEEYFILIRSALSALNDLDLPLELHRLWFNSRLLFISGHMPNLTSDNQNQVISKESRFNFDTDKMCFLAQPDGQFSPDHIKFWRIVFVADNPKLTARVNGGEQLARDLLPLSALLLGNSHL
ncbi:DNA repair protein RecO [Patescibacteria group bacterium]|nr:DNA repair protein RecO [Patescibacteria group bacterium]